MMLLLFCLDDVDYVFDAYVDDDDASLASANVVYARDDVEADGAT